MVECSQFLEILYCILLPSGSIALPPDTTTPLAASSLKFVYQVTEYKHTRIHTDVSHVEFPPNFIHQGTKQRLSCGSQWSSWSLHTHPIYQWLLPGWNAYWQDPPHCPVWDKENKCSVDGAIHTLSGSAKHTMYVTLLVFTECSV